jgi:dolichol-phosphate mannosyltransferase
MFNEEAAAEACVRAVSAALDRLDRPSALIVVDDGSSDRTASILRELSSRFPRLILEQHERNQGYGAALQTGARVASERGYAYVLYMDSDLTNSPEDIPRFVQQMDAGVDVIKASRYSPGGGMKNVPWRRQAISAIGNMIARALFRLPIRDCTNGFRAVRTALLTQMTLSERRFPVIAEELYWCRFLARTYADVPVVLTSRQDSGKQSSFAYRPSVFWRYLRYALMAFLGVRPRGLAKVKE